MVAPLLNMSEEEVLWELPLCRGMAYWHHALVVAGNTMEFPGDDENDPGISGAREILKRFREKRGGALTT